MRTRERKATITWDTKVSSKKKERIQILDFTDRQDCEVNGRFYVSSRNVIWPMRQLANDTIGQCYSSLILLGIEKDVTIELEIPYRVGLPGFLCYEWPTVVGELSFGQMTLGELL